MKTLLSYNSQQKNTYKMKIKYRNIGAEVPKVPKERIRHLHIRIFKNIKKKLTGLCTAG